MNMLSPYAWAAAGLVVLTLFGGTYWRGYTAGKAHVQAEWDNDKDVRKIAEQAAVAARLRANEAKAAADAAEKARLKKGYADEIAKIRSDADAHDAAVQLRIPAFACAGLTASGKADSAGRGDANVAVAGVLPEATTRNLLALMEQADQMVAGCRVAQQFIQSQGMAP